MGQCDTVAVVALTVSLIALLGAVGQISQQFLGTADGYRRCKEEVIGAWALRTYRKWHWYEFRFGTKFTVPDVDLLSDFVSASAASDRQSLLANFKQRFLPH